VDVITGLANCRKNSLLNGITSLSTPAHTIVKAIAGGMPHDILQKKFLKLATLIWTNRELRHDTAHHIRTTPGPSVACCSLRLASDRWAVAKAELDCMLQQSTA
jgi:hypothetical protein